MSDALDLVKNHYAKLPAALEAARAKLGRSLTLAEKVLVSHLDDPNDVGWARGEDFLLLRPDRVAMQDATAQMALLQFMMAGRDKVAVPSTVHCDHLIQARKGAKSDLLQAIDINEAVYDFLETVSARYGIGFWKPGAGIIHQVVLENYAFPGGMMIGTDSHTVNAGGLGMVAVGVGGADAVDVMVGMPWEVKAPKLIGVKLTGKLNGWASAKDVILKVCEILTVKGGTNSIVEYFGPGARTLSGTGKGTICNMGAEHGATTSMFPFDEKMAEYLEASGRGEWAELARANAEHLVADPDVEANPENYFDRIVEIDLSELTPHLAGPHTPDLVRAIADMKDEAPEKGYPVNVTNALIGSCTNSSYEDIARSAHIARQATAKGLKAKIPLWISPGSDTVFETIKAAGFVADLEAIGGTILSNSCGPCIGQWKRDDTDGTELNSIVNSFNRNFKKRNDGFPTTLSFIGSPELVTAIALSGRLDFDPTRDSIDGISLSEPEGDELPEGGLELSFGGFVEAPADGSGVEVAIPDVHERLQRLTPFSVWDGKDLEDQIVLLKAFGKCTTDHISQAGPWLKYRGHLDNISNNMFLGAVNAFAKENPGHGKDQLDGETKKFPAVARNYKANGRGWVVFGDENYGEGSSREHAAMEPRHLGCTAVIVRSFARIHETNLKKQGVLGLTFVNPASYDLVQEDDRVAIRGVTELAPGKNLTLELTHSDGSVDSFEVAHTLNDDQIEWFKAGSALNKIRADLGA
ncbi:MAG: aconitate hydratase [Deltaproteobacteria bacterium]|nr:aconitate hydratase [Deltaproteobacteria bacterium]